MNTGKEPAKDTLAVQEEHLLSISRKDYKELLLLFQEGKKQGVHSEAFTKFHEKLYVLGIIFSFDWMPWEEGQTAFNSNPYDYAGLPLLELSKHITAIFRADRFNDGTIASAMDKGILDNLIIALVSNASDHRK